ncbi:MAG: aminoglycoside phosphotransferase, partial [Rubrivivax sp.]
MQSDSPGEVEPATPARGSPVRWSDPARERAFEHWFAPLAARHGLRRSSLRPASADASFRRYLRVDADRAGQTGSLIVMDAPPEWEDVRPFVAVARLIRQAGLV